MNKQTSQDTQKAVHKKGQQMNQVIPISVIINTLNESINLSTLLPAIIHIFDEVVVVDMDSEDGTAVIAHNYGARIIGVKKMGYVEPARKVGIEQARNNIIFVLDADETPSEGLIEYLRNQMKTNFSALKDNNISIPRLNIMLGKKILYGSYKPDSDTQLRIFKKDNIILSDVIHKGISNRENIGTIYLRFEDNHYLLHKHSESAYPFLSRLVRYCAYEVKEHNSGANSFSIYRLIKRFLVEYLYKLSFLNGRVGFAVAYIVSIRDFLKCR